MRRNGVGTLDADLLEDLDDQRLDRGRRSSSGVRERHLDVDLRELGLAVGAQVLVAEAAHDLEVAVHARHHQDLLEDLRRLRQREELARVHAARHQVVARALRRRLRQDRRLDLPEALRVEVLAESPSSRGDAGRGCAAAAGGADRDSDSAGGRPRRPACRRQSGTAASSPRSAAGSRCASTSTSPVVELRVDGVGAAPLAPCPITATTNSDRSRLATAISALVVRHDDLRDAVRDRGRRGTAAPPRSRTRCTQPSRTTSRADVGGAQRAAGVGAGERAELVSH